MGDIISSTLVEVTKTNRKRCLVCNKTIPKGARCLKTATSAAYGTLNFRCICTSCTLLVITETDAAKYLTKKGKALAVARRI